MWLDICQAQNKYALSSCVEDTGSVTTEDDHKTVLFDNDGAWWSNPLI